MDSESLIKALKECADGANRGYKLAKDGLGELKTSISIAVKQIKDSIVLLDNSRVNSTLAIETLNNQLVEIGVGLDGLASSVEFDIAKMKKTMSSFSIALFGRTMAGKSTFMEILIHGTGDSIGKGAQRTTRDVRTYEWNGLKITDVPGIAAFEGDDDETTAFEAAKSADLIIFLITDDAPQASEAECLAKICNLGKPVLCLINVKVDVDISNIKISLRDIVKSFDFERLDAIKRQFLSFSRQYGQDWRGIRFVCVHLKSAFLAQQQDYAECSEKLFELSNFAFVEQVIIQEVITRGKFYRIKNFIDSLCTPLLETVEKLLEQGVKNSEQGRLILSKRRALNDWIKSFEVDSKGQIESLLTKMRSELIGEIASFAEDNYDNTKASEAWGKLMKEKRIQDRCEKLVKSFLKLCEDKLKEIAREINQEVSFAENVFIDNSINMSKLVDGKRIWDWSVTGITGGLAIAALFNLWNPAGWVAIGVGVLGWIGSFFFDSREKRKLDARRNLEKKLTEHIDKTIGNLRKEMIDILTEELIKKRLYVIASDMNSLINSLFKLSETQKELGWKLNSKLKETNKHFFAEALAFLGASGLEWHIRDLARIQGNAIMMVLDDGKVFPNDIRIKLSNLLKEKIWFVFYSEYPEVLLSRAIGRSCSRENISIEYKLKIAHIPVKDFDANTINRVRLAQQITELLITK